MSKETFCVLYFLSEFFAFYHIDELDCFASHFIKSKYNFAKVYDNLSIPAIYVL